MANDMTVGIGAKISDFARKMKTAGKLVKSLPNKTVTKVVVKVKEANRRLNSIATTIRSIGEVSMSMISGALISSFSGLIPVIASAASAIGGLIPILGAAAGGALGLGSAFATAGIGVAAFAGVAAPIIGGVIKKSEELKKINEKIATASTEKQKNKYMKEKQRLLSKMTDEQKNAVKSIQDFKSNWDKFSKSIQKPVFKVFTKSMKTLMNILDNMKPTIMSAAGAISNLLDKLNATLNTKDMQTFFKWLGKNAGPAIESFGTAFLNVMRGVANLLVAFGPLSKSMQGGLVGMTKAFADWTSGIGETDGFKAFIAYVKENGPKLFNIIGDIALALVGIGKAFAPFGGDMLSGIASMTEKFKDWANSLGKSEGFHKFMDYVRTNGPKILKLIGNLADVAVQLATAMAPIGAKVLDVVNSFLQWFNAMLKAHPQIGKIIGIVITMIGILKLIGPPILLAQSLFGGFVLKMFKGIGKLGPKIASFAETTALKFMYIGDKVKLLGRKIKNLAVKFAKNTAKMVKKAAVWAAKTLKSIAKVLARYAILAARSLIYAARVAASWFIALGPIGWVIAAVIGLVVLIIANWDKVWKWTKKIFGWVWGFLKKIWNKTVSFITDTATDIWKGIKDVWDRVMEFLKGIDLVEIGKDIIRGLIKGVGKMASAVIDKVTGVIGGAIGAAKKLLGIKSPSRVFMQIGQYTGEGMMIGMDRSLKKVRGASLRLAQATIPSIQGAGGPALAATSTAGHSTTVNNKGLLEGATFNVREEADIQKLAVELGDYIDRKSRG